MHRFFVPSAQINNQKILIEGNDVNHIKNVLRMNPSDCIEVFDSSGNIYKAKIKEISSQKILCAILETSKDIIEPKINITIAQCLPKSKKMDFIIQKTTELGAKTIIPIISERSIPKIDDKAQKKILHWQAIAKEAAEQSGRSIIPEVGPLTYFKDLVKDVKKYALRLIPWEGEKENTLKSVLVNFKNNEIQTPDFFSSNKVIVIIGPEGGFSRHEIDTAKEQGFICLSLGKRILKAETASITFLAQFFYEFEQ